jgi:hypothetical protein
MTNLVLWAAFWVLLFVFIAALLTRGTHRRLLKEKRMHPYRMAHQQEMEEDAGRAQQH